MEVPLLLTLLLITGKWLSMHKFSLETAHTVFLSYTHCDASRETTNLRSKHVQAKLGSY